ncbi:hypothetical protein LARI1_G007360 [Lachnellula arida]|uniref:Heterokaryon incompatibility domain-containing protein n=1 Tax=Lachnellula arida TaxID=1316785 RepID=A0A8T9B523_9HELO|nr:hypothetical protein LARI1_G007360 [Lachnellula arida]
MAPPHSMLGACSSKDPKAQRAIWNNTAPNFIHRVHVIQEWLDVCERQHPNCQSAEIGLSTRSLDLDTQELDVVQLVGMQDIEKTSGLIRYAALSHCWGSGSLLCKTTKLNSAVHRKGIQTKSLPRTFQDAIRITITLGIRYLWIDALCIIQDDADDWSIEAAKMAQVYQGSYITLAATSAQDGNGGLFVDALRSPTLVVSTDDDPQLQGNTVEASSLTTTCLVRCSIGSLRDIWDSSLSRRAWVLQELVLSPRLVHFTSQQMYYQCHEGIESEDRTLKVAGFSSIKSGSVAAEADTNGL